MSLFITRDDVERLLRFATYSAAIKVGVPNAMWEDPDQLVAEIQRRNAALASELRAFREAYGAWFAFWDNRDKKGVTSPVVGAELGELENLVKFRDSVHAALVQSLK